MSTDRTTAAESPETLVEKVRRATRIRGTVVEARQNGTRHVIVIEDDAGKRILAYCDPRRGGKFRVHVQHYGREEQMTVESVDAAAAAVKTSERRKPKPKRADETTEASVTS